MVDVIEHGRNGLLVPVGDAVALGEALKALLGEPARAKKLAEQARRDAEQRFSVAASLAALSATYDFIERGRGGADTVARAIAETEAR